MSLRDAEMMLSDKLGDIIECVFEVHVDDTVVAHYVPFFNCPVALGSPCVIVERRNGTLDFTLPDEGRRVFQLADEQGLFEPRYRG